jgi:hypothetical protein
MGQSTSGKKVSCCRLRSSSRSRNREDAAMQARNKFALTAAVLLCVMGNIPAGPAYSEEQTLHDWAEVTVLTIAPDGTWGAATDDFANVALAHAIADCKSKYKNEIGCGHRSTFVRQGWSLAFRCGPANVLVAEKLLADAEQAALRQERELRLRYAPNMPACVRTVTVDPYGRIVAPEAEYSSSLSRQAF